MRDLEARPGLADGVEQIDEVSKGAAQAVETPDSQHIARREGCEGSGESGSGKGGSRILRAIRGTSMTEVMYDRSDAPVDLLV